MLIVVGKGILFCLWVKSNGEFYQYGFAPEIPSILEAWEAPDALHSTPLTL